jgi:hypothetical protein
MGFNQAFLDSEIVRAHSTKKIRPAKGIYYRSGQMPAIQCRKNHTEIIEKI